MVYIRSSIQHRGKRIGALSSFFLVSGYGLVTVWIRMGFFAYALGTGACLFDDLMQPIISGGIARSSAWDGVLIVPTNNGKGLIL